MTYELALKLKKAGFPGMTYAECGIMVGIPTLEELIEYCGDKFHGLTRGESVDGTRWYATGGTEQEGVLSLGDSKEEAVANLWIELNKK